MGIRWIGSGAAGKVAFMLVMEVSVVVDMMIRCRCHRTGVGGRLYSKRTVKIPQEEIQLINVLYNYVLLLC